MRQICSWYPSSADIKNTKVKKNCKLKKEYYYTSDWFIWMRREDIRRECSERQLVFPRRESLRRGSHETWRSHVSNAADILFQLTTSDHNKWTVEEGTIGAAHIFFSADLFVLRKKETASWNTRGSDWMNITAGWKKRDWINSQTVTVNALRAVLRCFAVRRLNYTAHGIQIDYRAFLPPKSGGLIDEKRERWKRRD